MTVFLNNYLIKLKKKKTNQFKVNNAQLILNALFKNMLKFVIKFQERRS